MRNILFTQAIEALCIAVAVLYFFTEFFLCMMDLLLLYFFYFLHFYSIISHVIRINKSLAMHLVMLSWHYFPIVWTNCLFLPSGFLFGYYLHSNFSSHSFGSQDYFVLITRMVFPSAIGFLFFVIKRCQSNFVLLLLLLLLLLLVTNIIYYIQAIHCLE